ncbi:hypothetical protein ASG87_10600 [Frateuria sp. Soil773]|uniref:hypothetical protein n=1 Tax=Frateuria sp. Soil773 TaxID=1736407 RepID=UPI0006FBD4F8|nr:hypothetical protein [Frateuria sp. Soil773]KRF01945.1 hypothetical protein ASG87_10600 [Frateuria sp. Soil773]
MKILPPLLCALALGACSHKVPEPQAAAAKADAARVATPWDDLKKQEQRAKDVQKVVDQQAEQQRKQIEAAEQ